jgi:hypothetical protein
MTNLQNLCLDSTCSCVLLVCGGQSEDLRKVVRCLITCVCFVLCNKVALFM